VRGGHIFTIVVVITTVSISSAMRGCGGGRKVRKTEERRCVKYYPKMTVRLSFVQEKPGGLSLWASNVSIGAVTLPAYEGDDAFLAERSAVRVGRAVQGPECE